MSSQRRGEDLDLEESVRQSRIKKFGSGSAKNRSGSQRPRGLPARRSSIASFKVEEDKRLKAAIKKFGLNPIEYIEEVCMYKNDGSVIYISRP